MLIYLALEPGNVKEKEKLVAQVQRGVMGLEHYSIKEPGACFSWMYSVVLK